MRVWAWGDNTCGELGDGTTANKLSPEPIGLVGVTRVAMGQSFLLDTYSAAIRSDGTLWTWGCNAFGQLGYGAVTGAVHNPTQVTSLAGVSQFASGDDSNGNFHPGAWSSARSPPRRRASFRLRLLCRGLHLHQHRHRDMAEPGRGDTRQPRRRCLRQDRDGSAAAARMPVSLRAVTGRSAPRRGTHRW